MAASLTFADNSSFPSLGLCMLVRDSEATLAPALASVSGLVARMVVVDTGSVDASAEIARSFGATVVEFAWQNDFAAARNAGLQALDTDWVLVLDADEELPREACEWIRKELRAPAADGYVVPIRNYVPPWDEPHTEYSPVPAGEQHPRASDAKVFCHSKIVRLFRRDPEVHYIGHVHEQVEYRLNALNRSIQPAGFFLHHFGWYLIDERGHERKRALYRELLERKLQERPDDTQALLQYGDSLLHWTTRKREALDCFVRAAGLAPDHCQVWLQLAAALVANNFPAQAITALDEAQKAPRGERSQVMVGRLAQIRAEAQALLGQWDEARESMKVALECFPGQMVMESKLAAAEVQSGDVVAGRARMAGLLARAEADARGSNHPTLLLRAGEMHLLVEQWEQAFGWLDQAQRAAAENESPNRRAQIDRQRLRAAVLSGRGAAAIESAQRLQAFAPAPDMALLLAALLRELRLMDRAAVVLEEALQQFPDSGELRAALGELRPEPVANQGNSAGALVAAL